MTAQAAPYAARESRLLMQAVTVQRESASFSRCVYCSAHCVGKACRCHQDLLRIEREMLQ